MKDALHFLYLLYSFLYPSVIITIINFKDKIKDNAIIFFVSTIMRADSFNEQTRPHKFTRSDTKLL